MTKGPPITRRTPMLAAVLAVAGANAADCEPGSSSEALQAEQKIRLLERLTSDSEPLRRLQESGDEAALAIMDNALAIMASAQQAIADGCAADAAALSNEALRLATAAFRASPAPARGARDEFDAEIARARSFLASLEGRPEEATGLDATAMAGIERQVRNAESLAASGSIDEARQLLLPVNDRLQRRLLEMFDRRTIYYEHEFATPADEFAYLEQQYDGYMLLLRSGNKTTPYSARQRVADMLEAAGRRRQSADSHAEAGEWSDALAEMNAALEHCEHATRATGYTF